MNIVLNEYEWAETAIAEHRLGKKPYDTLLMVAKYYFANGYKKSEVRDLLEVFMLKCDGNVSLSKWSDTLDNLIKRAAKSQVTDADSVIITKPELDAVDALDGKPLRRLAFTLLCLSKYGDAKKSRNDHWVNTPDRDVMQMANIILPLSGQSKLYSELNRLGMIQFSKRIGNLSVRVLFQADGEQALSIDDFRNLGYQYQRLHENGYIECQNCGIVIPARSPKKGRPQKYCPECAAEIKMKQSIESAMRLRAAKQSA